MKCRQSFHNIDGQITGFRRTRYSAVVEPALARTRLCSNWRIFQQQTVPHILDAVLKAHGLNDFEQRL
ncbi:contractile injection system protein, VgrG/Pvc8 family, partial [Pseudomonas sp. NPDC096917]|uniref:contractile injection system protein, VgrG/Pvc8 family n=1 Tax=Pseudomonas sp. NPDC096917 TaxID=3364483 RepID=UPI00383BE8B6